MITITNPKTKLSKSIQLDNLSFQDLEKTISFYVNCGYDYKIIR